MERCGIEWRRVESKEGESSEMRNDGKEERQRWGERSEREKP